jgi:intracellular multiplication protein IcmB
MNIFSKIAEFFQSFLAWMGSSLRQNTSAYCEIQTADSATTLVSNDGSLVSVIKISGVTSLIGRDEFFHIKSGLQQSLQTAMSKDGHVLQFFFSHSKDDVKKEIKEIFSSAELTAKRLDLNLSDFFQERINNMSKYCAHEEVYLVVWTKVSSLSSDQSKFSRKEKSKFIKGNNIPPFKQTQNIIAAVSQLRDSHDSFVKLIIDDFCNFGVVLSVLEVHDAVHAMRVTADPEFTDREWKAVLPGDKVTVKELKNSSGELSDLLWPSLAKQILPRDAERLDLRTVRLGDRIYSTVYVDLFPKDVLPFVRLFSKTIQSSMPWRMSFLMESNGLGYSNVRSILASVLTVTSAQNRLISDSLKLLSYVNLNSDDAVVRLRVSATTWANDGDLAKLRSRTSLLARAIEGWGSCDVSEISGDAFEGVASTMLGVTSKSPAQATLAPLSDVLHMLPLYRPSSPWNSGAMLFRSPDGKLWPYQPGSHKQSTFIDLFYARPGSGKSVLSNAINLAACLSSGIDRLPRIAIIDIGPSSSGLISLLKDALPANKKHLVAYHRLQMTTNYAINPFDTQLGCRFPTPQERSFLVNFLSLLATPVGSDKSYDGVSDMSGLIIDELYKKTSDDANPNLYASAIEEKVDGVLEEIDFIADTQTTWWEVADALFMSGFHLEALQAQRHAMPLLADVASICRDSAIEDLYGKIIVPTGEPLIQAFSRMISSAAREYPIISQVTRFDIGEARVIALDLDEVAKSGGDAANRQTSVMYMLARYVLGRNFYLTDENVNDMPESYRNYHKIRINEIKEDPKRIVYDEFHRTAHAKAVRDQVVVDMREGRKWKVQVALLSQSLADFDDVMVEFATSVFILEAGPEVAVNKTAEVFGLSDTAKHALRNRVHGPRESGSTFLAQFATNAGNYTQLLTSTLGPIELWALSTSADDVSLRNRLYRKLDPAFARRLLAKRFPSGSACRVIENMLSDIKESDGFIDDAATNSIIDQLADEIIAMGDQSLS